MLRLVTGSLPVKRAPWGCCTTPAGHLYATLMNSVNLCSGLTSGSSTTGGGTRPRSQTSIQDSPALGRG